MTRALVVGIGSGDPAHLTGEAVAALREVDLFLVADKGGDKRDLVELRRALLQTVRPEGFRLVAVDDPPRGPDVARDRSAYERGVADWHADRAERYADLIRRELGETGTIGFLVWGDPSLYDSTIRITDAIGARGVDLEVRVIPGISSLSLLAARHGIALNEVGRSVHITTGRRLVAEYSPALGDVAVMLDGDLACAGLLPRWAALTIFWGAQLGLPDETLRSGRLGEVLDEVRTVREQLRAERGWVMDSYLLRADSDPVRREPWALRLRPVRIEDQAVVRRAQQALGAEAVFAQGLPPEREWSDYLDELARFHAGEDVGDWVRWDLLLAEVDGEVVGRISVRYDLTEELLAEGGHIGYVVLPQHRRRGYATEMLRQALIVLRAAGVQPVLITCDDDNVASRLVIETAGGVRDEAWPTAMVDDVAVRRYWIG